MIISRFVCHSPLSLWTEIKTGVWIAALSFCKACVLTRATSETCTEAKMEPPGMTENSQVCNKNENNLKQSGGKRAFNKNGNASQISSVVRPGTSPVVCCWPGLPSWVSGNVGWGSGDSSCLCSCGTLVLGHRCW